MTDATDLMAAHQPHPFHAIGALAASRGNENLVLKVERGGDYVRLISREPSVFFKYRPDPGDSIDRIGLDHFKRILLSEEDCANGPDQTLALIERLLEKFAGYRSQRPLTQPTTGRDK